tara:strand:- start:581 stop:1204 length:624 start_codon:yes stop_codon:yes gene_type:complete
LSKIIDFICIRIQSELEKYDITGTLPAGLLDGIWTIDDVEGCMIHFTAKQTSIAKKIILEYNEHTGESLDSLKQALKREYVALLQYGRSRDPQFAFPQILKKYRNDINPIRALYYDTRDMVRRYDPTSEHHMWLSEVVTDLEFNNKLLDAIESDLKKVEKFIKRYYWPILQHDDGIPLELFHARQMSKDAKFYAGFFFDLQSWEPDQ